MKTLIKLTMFTVLPVLTLASLANASPQEVTKQVDGGAYKQDVGIDGETWFEQDRYAFLILGTSRIEFDLPGGSRLEVLPELIVPLGQFDGQTEGMRIPEDLPAGILVQGLVMRADRQKFWTSRPLDVSSALRKAVSSPPSTPDCWYLYSQLELCVGEDGVPYWCICEHHACSDGSTYKVCSPANPV